MAVERIVVSTGMMVVIVVTGRYRSLVRMSMVTAVVVAMAEAELYRRPGQAQKRHEKPQHY